MFDGPVTSLLSVLCILIEALSRAVEKLKWFQVWHSHWPFSEWQSGKYGGESVKAHSHFPNTKCATARNYGSGHIYVGER